MDHLSNNGFISLGCDTDRDCVYNNSDGTDIYNYQSCRHYPSKGLPKKNETNGCMCLNFVTTAAIDTETGRVFCTKSDAGSIALYVVDCFILILQFIIIFRCLYLLLFFGVVKVKQLRRNGMKRERPVSLVKRHSLLCLFFLMMNALCFSIFRIITLIGFIASLKTDIEIPKKQGRLDEGSPRAILWIAYMFLDQCCLHFTILWLSTTKALFSQEVSKNSGWFNVKFYKRFINLVQVSIALIVFIPIFLKMGIDFLNFVVLATGIIIVYEFAWGCGNIVRLLRLIASWTITRRLSSVVVDTGIQEDDTATKLSKVADKIENFSSKVRISGGLLLAFYGAFIIMSFLG